MGDSNKVEDVESYNLYNPCYYLDMAARGFLKCFGIDCMSGKEGNEKRNETSLQGDPSSTQEQEMKSNEDERSGFAIFTSTLRIRATKPKVGGGAPPQHNSISS